MTCEWRHDALAARWVLTDSALPNDANVVATVERTHTEKAWNAYLKLRTDPCPKFIGQFTSDVEGVHTVVTAYLTSKAAVQKGDSPLVKPVKKVFRQRKNEGRRQIATLVPLGALEAIANASEVGLVKYEIDSYREDGGYSLGQCLNSAARHIYARTGGQRYDPNGSKLLGRPIDHIDMATWNMAVACEMQRLFGDENDDLWKGLPKTVSPSKENSSPPINNDPPINDE